MSDDRPFIDPAKPGRKDINGVEWWATDPYPLWYRRDEDDEIILKYSDNEWEDELLECENCGGPITLTESGQSISLDHPLCVECEEDITLCFTGSEWKIMEAICIHYLTCTDWTGYTKDDIPQYVKERRALCERILKS